MPTFNQLIHTGRAVSEKKAKAPALLNIDFIKKEEVSYAYF